MKVFLTGATGFVGTHVLRALRTADHTVRCLVRDATAPQLAVQGDGIEVVQGSITDYNSLNDAMTGCDAVIHLVGIIEEKPSKGITFEAIHYRGTMNMAEHAKRAGIGTFIHMSANGVKKEGVSAYQTTKWHAEEHLKASGFAHWTIFRPSIIFGDPEGNRPEFATRLARTLIRPFPLIPILGDGMYELQPIAVQDVAAAMVAALTTEHARGQTYTAVGPTRVSFIEAVDVITEAMGLAPKRKVHQSLKLVRLMLNTVGRLGLLPISADQLAMLLEGNTGDPAPFAEAFGLDLIPFTPASLAYVKND